MYAGSDLWVDCGRLGFVMLPGLASIVRPEGALSGRKLESPAAGKKGFLPGRELPDQAERSSRTLRINSELS